MFTAFSFIIFLKNWTMVSDFKFIPYFNIFQNFVQNVGKPKMAIYPELPSMIAYLPH